jgi:sigma-70 region 2
MMKSVIKKYLGYANKVGLDYDDLFQEASMAVLQAENTYKDDKGMKLETWLYNNIDWRIQRVLGANKKYEKIISVNSTVESGEGDTIELIDLIADELDLQEEIQNKLMINYYESECRRVLPEDKFQVCYLKWFKGCSNAYIAEVTHRKYIHDVLLSSRSLILAKSRTLKEEYHKLHNIDDYSHTERLALLDS